MESLDFVLDLTEKLRKQNIDHLLITLRKSGENECAADIFCSMEQDNSRIGLEKILKKLYKEMAKKPAKAKKKIKK